MSKWALVQAVYCLTGIGFFVRDLLAHVAMQTAMINAFIWPYAQWFVLEAYVLQGVDWARHIIT